MVVATCVLRTVRQTVAVLGTTQTVLLFSLMKIISVRMCYGYLHHVPRPNHFIAREFQVFRKMPQPSVLALTFLCNRIENLHRGGPGILRC